MRDMAKIVTVISKGKMFEKDKICYVSFEETAYECIVPITVNVGDKMVFIEADSILPIEDRWEFLRKRCYREKLNGFLISPMVMGAKDDNGQKGERVKSWGLCVTLAEAGIEKDLKAGTDVTDLLNIRKYEPAEDASPKPISIPRFVKFCLKHKLTRWIGNIYMKRKKRKSSSKGGFPTELISKSDETTIQNCKSIINTFPGRKAFITAKMEGCSATYSLDLKNKRKPKLYVCSRNNRYDIEVDAAKVYYEYANRTDLEKKLLNFYKQTGKNIILQGELCSSNVQGNIYDFDDSRFFVYRMKLLENGKWIEYNYEQMTPIIESLDLERVPLIEVVDDMGSKFQTIDQLVDYTEHTLWKPTKDSYDFHHQPKSGEKLWRDYLMAEGIVIKSDNYNKELGSGFSFKCKNLPYQEKKYTEMHAIAQKIKNSL